MLGPECEERGAVPSFEVLEKGSLGLKGDGEAGSVGNALGVELFFKGLRWKGPGLKSGDAVGGAVLG
jgi:hypothetical protein